MRSLVKLSFTLILNCNFTNIEARITLNNLKGIWIGWNLLQSWFMSISFGKNLLIPTILTLSFISSQNRSVQWSWKLRLFIFTHYWIHFWIILLSYTPFSTKSLFKRWKFTSPSQCEGTLKIRDNLFSHFCQTAWSLNS